MIKNSVPFYARELILAQKMKMTGFKVALYTDKAELGEGSTTYSPENEIRAVAYTVGGKDCPDPKIEGRNLYFEGQVTWQGATITAFGAVVYNESAIIATVDFGGPVSSTNDTWSFEFGGKENPLIVL
jgi:hypothetical protein